MKLTNEAYNKILLIISARLELMKELSGFVPSLENIKPAIEDAIAFSGIDCDEEDKNKYDYPHNSPNYKITRKYQSCKGKVLENARHS